MTSYLSVGRFLAALAVLIVPSVASAQECVGLPGGGRGVLTYGFEGTDGATGQGLGFAFQTQRAAIILQHRWLDDVSLLDTRRTTDVQVSMRPSSLRMPVCVTGGLQWTSYDSDRVVSQRWNSDDPAYSTMQLRVGGPYQRARIPVGLAFGREFELGGSVSVTPFLAPGLVYEHETYRPETGSKQVRRTLGWRADGGITGRIGWLVFRSIVRQTRTQDYTLSSQHNFMELTVQAGVRF